MTIKNIMCLIIIAMMLSACSTKAENNNGSEENQNQEAAIMENSQDETWKQEVADRLLAEFYTFYENMEEDDLIRAPEGTINRYKYNEERGRTGYSRAMTIDRAQALLGVYREYIPEKDREFILSVKDEINWEIISSRVSFAYTNSGLHFIALREGVIKNSLFYRPLCDEIRGIKEESQFFSDMRSLNYTMCDLYVEDLKASQESINVEVKLYASNGPDKPFKKTIAYNLIEDGLDILKEYDRQISQEGSAYQNKSWNLLACHGYFDIVKVTVDNEEFELVDYITVKEG